MLFGLSLFAEFLANDKPILVNYRGEFYTPMFKFYPETAFGGDFQTEAAYRDPEVQCLIATGQAGSACFDDPEGILYRRDRAVHRLGRRVRPLTKGWTIWPPHPYSFDTACGTPRRSPTATGTHQNLLGTDDTKRDVLARVIYGFRLSILLHFDRVTGASPA